MLPQISYTPSNFPNASAASPCSPLTSSSIFIHFVLSGRVHLNGDSLTVGIEVVNTRQLGQA